MLDLVMQCKMGQALMMVFLINNLNEFGKLKVGEQFFLSYQFQEKMTMVINMERHWFKPLGFYRFFEYLSGS